VISFAQSAICRIRQDAHFVHPVDFGGTYICCAASRVDAHRPIRRAPFVEAESALADGLLDPAEA